MQLFMLLCSSGRTNILLFRSLCCLELGENFWVRGTTMSLEGAIPLKRRLAHVARMALVAVLAGYVLLEVAALADIDMADRTMDTCGRW